ncbi:unnamed protein product [Rhizoctonia solani]|uniref:CFEM domain-containing protein n=1 Tax=Rhizoctonia solani TaxID=456999 RepID=A0A8H2W9Y8_9AGAM|nr:unnamed protein product [Rhizoctonia solani]
MRIASIVVLTLALRIFAQSTGTESNNGSNLSTSSTTESDTLVSVAPTTTISEPENSGTTTTTSTTESPTATAPPPVGGGATCVQSCLAKAATQVGCKNLVDVPCVCQSAAYMSTAQICFNDSFCQNADVQNAIEDYGTVCRNGNQNSGTETSPRSTSPTPSRTRSRSDGLTSATTQTFIVTSGAVLTLSGGSTTRIVSDFTTTRTGQVGDFATDSTPVQGTETSRPTSNYATSVHLIGRNHGQALATLGIFNALVTLLF